MLTQGRLLILFWYLRILKFLRFQGVPNKKQTLYQNVSQISIALQKYNKKMTYARVHAIFCLFYRDFYTLLHLYTCNRIGLIAALDKQLTVADE